MERQFMKRALTLASLGEGRVNPNPLVGAVIVKDGEVISEGYHMGYGGKHAEVEALDNSTIDVRGGEMYVNLEPCSHYGKTPPCADRIVKEGIKKVYIAMEDPNPKVRGRGIEILRAGGVKVDLGLMEDEARELNRVFSHYIKNNSPLIALKYGMTIDGKIATKDFESKWITSKESREDVQRLRNKYMGIMVGINTVLKDDPRLTCRIESGRDPIKIVLDTRLRIGLDSKLVKNSPKSLIIFTSKNHNREKASSLKDRGVRVLEVPLAGGGLDLKEVVRILGKLQVDSILLEGGSQLNFSFVELGLVDKFHIYISPKILGGVESKTPVGGRGFSRLADHLPIDIERINRFGEDIYIEAKKRE